MMSNLPNHVNSDVETCAQLLTIWSMYSLHSDENPILFNPEYEKQSFIAKILRKKMEVFKIDIKLPDPLIMIIEVCTGCNPGVSQLLLKRVLAQNKFVTSKKVVTPTMFAAAFGDSFPVMSNPEWEKKLHEEWDRQKAEDGSNKCDTPEWWRDFT